MNIQERFQSILKNKNYNFFILLNKSLSFFQTMKSFSRYLLLFLQLKSQFFLYCRYYKQLQFLYKVNESFYEPLQIQKI